MFPQMVGNIVFSVNIYKHGWILSSDFSESCQVPRSAILPSQPLIHASSVASSQLPFLTAAPLNELSIDPAPNIDDNYYLSYFEYYYGSNNTAAPICTTSVSPVIYTISPGLPLVLSFTPGTPIAYGTGFGTSASCGTGSLGLTYSGVRKSGEPLPSSITVDPSTGTI